MPVNKGAGAYRLDWRGRQVDDALVEGLSSGLAEIGLRIEAAAKARLRPSEQVDDEWVEGGGHGKRTGTLQRSIHNAQLGYDWASDNVEPGAGTPERGGSPADPTEEGDALWIEVGSGLEYAMPVHENHYDPEVNQFILAAADDVAPKVPGIIRRHVQAQA